MPRATTVTLDPAAEQDFLKRLRPCVDLLARQTSGARLAVVAHYQGLFDSRLADLGRLRTRRQRKGGAA